MWEKNCWDDLFISFLNKLFLKLLLFDIMEVEKKCFDNFEIEKVDRKGNKGVWIENKFIFGLVVLIVLFMILDCFWEYVSYFFIGFFVF